MADVDSSLRSVHTTSRTRILYGIGIAICGGESPKAGRFPMIPCEAIVRALAGTCIAPAAFGCLTVSSCAVVCIALTDCHPYPRFMR